MCNPTKQENNEKYINARRFRYEMLDTASSMLPKQKNKKGEQVPHRISTCSKHLPQYGIANEMGGIVISKNEQGRAYLSGVSVCSCVWGCPVCAEKIGSKRAVEVTTAISRHVVDNFGWGLFLTLTFSHKKSESLKVITDKLNQAQQEMRNSRPFKKAMKALGYVGYIKALEVTHGKNGWHPHTHELIFVDRKITQTELSELKTTIFNQWYYYCKKNNLGLPNFNGVDIQVPQDIEAISDYVGKWGYELTHLNIKEGKNGSRTPFKILADLTKKYNHLDHSLFQEFVQSFKGKKQLRWSTGLKAMFAITDLSDKDLNEQPEKEVIYILSKRNWYNILAARQRAVILEIAETGGAEAVKKHLEKLEDVLDVIRRKTHLQLLHSRQFSNLCTDHHVSKFYDLENDIFLSEFRTSDTSIFKQEMSQLKLNQSNQLGIIKVDETNLMQKYASNLCGITPLTNVRQLLSA